MKLFGMPEGWAEYQAKLINVIGQIDIKCFGVAQGGRRRSEYIVRDKSDLTSGKPSNQRLISERIEIRARSKYS